jgi:hypothetical protein
LRQAVLQEIEERTGRQISLGFVYTARDRMERLALFIFSQPVTLLPAGAQAGL